MKSACINPDDFPHKGMPAEAYAGWARARLREQGIEFRLGHFFAPTAEQVQAQMVEPWRMTLDHYTGVLTVVQG